MPDSQLDIAQFLNQQYLCESLTLRQVQTLLTYTKLVTFRHHDVIADIGDVSEALFFVVEGEAALFAERDGTQIEVGRMVEGELMGEMSFFDHKPRMARVVAISDEVKLLKLSRANYQKLRTESPSIAVNLLEHAIISLDHLVRRVTMDVTSFNLYMTEHQATSSPTDTQK